MSAAGQPHWMTIARRYLGVREAPGAANAATIMGWAQALGAKVLGIVYGADSIPWCGLYVAQVVSEAGFKPPPISVRARAWASWGAPCPPRMGAVLVFERPGGGHVGFYAGETDAAYRVLGGNQSDAVSLAWIAKARCIAVRWPPGAPEPARAGRVHLAAGGPLSENEA
jgi:uncharacterized protein (TIGR02594 family)